MKIYLVYHYTALEYSDNFFEPSSIVFHVTDSLANALCYMEEFETDPHSWWKVEQFTLNKIEEDIPDEQPEPNFWNEHHVGWYSHKVIKLEFSPFLNILEKIYKDRGIDQ